MDEVLRPLLLVDVLLVDVLSMRDFHNFDLKDLTFDKINDAVLTDADTPGIGANEFFAAMGSWILGEGLDGSKDSCLWKFWKPCDFFLGRG